MHLADNYSVITHQIVHVLLLFADGTIHTVEFRVIPALNHATILGMPFLHTLSPSIFWKTHTSIW